jgi:hypothetical protein
MPPQGKFQDAIRLASVRLRRKYYFKYTAFRDSSKGGFHTEAACHGDVDCVKTPKTANKNSQSGEQSLKLEYRHGRCICD